MLLWKETYPEEHKSMDPVDFTVPWAHWPRPPQGFLDFGYAYHFTYVHRI